MADATRPLLVAAAGNRFALLDAWRGELPRNPAGAARELCAAHGVDGLLLLERPRDGGACRMIVHNADGSRPEACGNGVRCVAKVARERGYVETDAFAVETDAGPRAVRTEAAPGAAPGGGVLVVSVQASMGRPRIVAERIEVRLEGRRWRATAVDVGNPHCVLFVEDVEQAPVARVGHALERHAGFEKGTNVEFVELAPDPALLRVRIWERGVGETGSCGTGVAAAVAATAYSRVRVSPLFVITRGGVLEARWDEAGEVWIAGSVA